MKKRGVSGRLGFLTAKSKVVIGFSDLLLRLSLFILVGFCVLELKIPNSVHLIAEDPIAQGSS